MVQGSPSENAAKTFNSPEVPLSCCEPRWYALYTCSNREKNVANQLARRDLEHFLPTYLSMRRWTDRGVMLERPLFPGYLFVRTALLNHVQVTRIPGAVRLVGFGGTPCALPDEQVLALQRCAELGIRTEPHSGLDFAVGRRVRILRGALRGLDGIVLKRKRSTRFVFSLQVLQRSISVEMDSGDLELFENCARKWDETPPPERPQLGFHERGTGISKRDSL